MKRTVKIIFIFLSFSFVVQSQTKIEIRAAKAYKQKDYSEAIQKYNAISKIQKLTEQQHLNLANSYFKIRDYKRAADKYKTHLSKINTLNLAQYNEYIQALKRSNYSEDSITAAIDARLDSLPKEIIKRYNLLKEERKRVKGFSKTVTSYEIRNLDINSSMSDFGVTTFPDSTIMFSSSRENMAFNNIYKEINQPYINIYETRLKNNNSIDIDTSRIKKYVEKSMMHTASAFYDPVYNRFFYTQSETKKNRLKFKNAKSNFRIVYGFMDVQKKLRNEHYYPKVADGYSYGHPFFDKDKKRLYFISDMPGGHGGTDIYYVEMDSKGITSKPVNLGEKVNSFANEMFPSVFDNQLYFSSNLFIGNGGLDVYSSKINASGFEYPLLLNNTINSSADDFDYKIIKSKKYEEKGYVSSNRTGGKGEDDIYSFSEYKTLKKIKVSGFVIQKIKDSIAIPKDSIITPKKIVPIPNATIVISNIAEGKIVATILTDNLGKYNVLLPIGIDYLFKVEKEGYVSVSDKILLANKNNLTPVAKDFYLIKELIVDKYGNLKINLEPVSFKYDSAEITPKGEKQLQFAINYLIKYPTDKIKLEAHTDSRGRSAYNLKLSDKRAKSVKDYLLAKGINPDRIVSAKGFGETKLLNKCKDYVKCSNRQHEQNRRTDFVIIRNYLK
jgi:outer membrane protein OmpA-like peptidoglycan-associated protein